MTLLKISGDGIEDNVITNAHLHSSADIAGTKLADGAITNAKVNASAAIAGSKISPDFGSQTVTTTGTVNTGLINASSASDQILNLNSSDNGAVYLAFKRSGGRKAYFGYGGTGSTISLANEISDGDIVIRGIDGGSNINMLSFNTSENGRATFVGNVNVGAGLDVTGIITGTSHLELPDDAKIRLGDSDDFEIFHQSSNSNSIIKENGGGILSLQTNGSQVSFYDTANNVLMAEFNTGGACTFRHGATTRLATTSTGINVAGNITINSNFPQIYFTDANNNSDYRLQNANGIFKIYDETNSADRLKVYSAGHVEVVNNLDVGAGIDVTGNITVTGTVDGVDIAARNTLFGGLTSSSGVLTNGVTGTTQGASDNTTKVATTAYVTTAISNLINGAPSALDTLNELAAAMSDDAAFSTTVTNSLATKMPLAGGQFTGNITFSGSQTVDGRDLSVDGTKLDGIESGATADQTASELLTLIKTVDGSGSGLDADTLDGISSPSFLRSDTADTFTADITSSGAARLLLKGASSGNASDHILIYDGTTLTGSIGCEDTSWLRLNQETSANIYTPRYIRADGGFFVDSTAKGINGSGNFIGGTIAGASDYGTLVRSDASDTLSGDYSFTGGANAISITSSDLGSDGSSNWTGDPGASRLKIQAHSNRWYIVSNGNSNRIVQFRHNGTDRTWIANDGQIYHGSGGTGDKYWRQGNDGAGSGLDADTVDGVEAANLIQTSSTTQQKNGALRIGGSSAGNSYGIAWSMNGTTAPASIGHTASNSEGFFWHNHSSNYAIYRTAGSWGGPNYQQLRLDWPTGIVLDGGSSYGLSGVRITCNLRMENTVSSVTNANSESILFKTIQTNGQAATTAGIHAQGQSAWGGDLVLSSKVANSTPNDTLTERVRITAEGSVKFILDGTPSDNVGSNIIVGRANTASEGGEIAMCRSSDNSPYWKFDCFGNTAQPKLRMHRAGSSVFEFNNNGNFYRAGSTTSDRDLKENIQNLTGTSLDKVIQLTPKTFNFKESEGYVAVPKTGFIAQEVAAVMPSLASGTDGNKDMGVDYDGVVAHLVNCVKELKELNDSLKTRIETLEAS